MIMGFQKPLRRVVLALTILAPFAAAAHHSHATIDFDDKRTYKGVVVKYGWTMPHVYLKVDAAKLFSTASRCSIRLQ
jgi:hypothetical protein